MKYLIKKLSIYDAKSCFFLIKDDLFLKKYDLSWNFNSLKNTLANEVNNSFGIYFDNNLLGYILSNFVSHKESSELEILFIFIHKSYRRLQLGTLLLEYLINKVGKENKLEVYLEIASSNVIAKHFYESFGFENFYNRKNYYKLHNGVREDAKNYKYILN